MAEIRAIAIACGGTGGHLFPGIAVAQELRRRGHRVLLFVSNKRIDSVALEGHEDLEREIVAMTGMPRPYSPAMAGFAARLISCTKKCGRFLDAFKADAVLGMGGFTSTPPVLAGRRRGLPVFLHESNAIPGKANRFTARFCRAVFLGMEECARHFGNRIATHVVGTPVREELRHKVDRSAAYAHFDLDPSKETLLVLGGSQGARGINRYVAEGLELLDATRYQSLHFSGKDDEDEVKSRYEATGLKHHVAAFSRRMDFALTLADVAVSRSGASALTELAFFRIPSILIPFPCAAEDHQTRNAEHYAAEGAALTVAERDLEGERLGRMIVGLLNDREQRRRLRDSMQKFASDNVNINICNILEKEIE